MKYDPLPAWLGLSLRRQLAHTARQLEARLHPIRFRNTTIRARLTPNLFDICDHVPGVNTEDRARFRLTGPPASGAALRATKELLLTGPRSV